MSYEAVGELSAPDQWIVFSGDPDVDQPTRRRPTTLVDRYIRAVGPFSGTVSIETCNSNGLVWENDGVPDQTRPFSLVLEVPRDLNIRVGVKTGNFTAVSDTVGTGDGSTTTFTGTLTGLPIIPGSLTVTAGSVTGTDDGSGNITGTGVSGTIDYTSGAISVTYTTAPASGTSVTASHRNGPVKVSIS